VVYTSYLTWEWGLILYSSSLVGEAEAPSCSAVCPHAATGFHTPSDTLPVPGNENSDHFLKGLSHEMDLAFYDMYARPE
jgi:hypothetical protein